LPISKSTGREAVNPAGLGWNLSQAMICSGKYLLA